MSGSQAIGSDPGKPAGGQAVTCRIATLFKYAGNFSVVLNAIERRQKQLTIQ
jgi:hypothetical protein